MSDPSTGLSLGIWCSKIRFPRQGYTYYAKHQNFLFYYLSQGYRVYLVDVLSVACLVDLAAESEAINPIIEHLKPLLVLQSDSVFTT